MLITPHLLAGAVIADKVGSFSWPVVVLATLSHFILDSIPHRDAINDNRLSKTQLIVSTIDLLIGVVLIWLVFRENNLNLAFFGAGWGILPDVIDNLPVIFQRLKKTKWWQVSHYWHCKIQCFKPSWTVGLFIQVLIVMLLIWVKVK